jgi:hypothetical protein
MISLIYREFSVKLSPEIIKKEYDGNIRTGVRTSIDITEIATGLNWKTITENRITDTKLESIIHTQFPNSQSAKEIKSIRNLREVTLVDDLSHDNIAVGIHTALRKLCDSIASSYWWNLIHVLPEGMMDRVWAITSNALQDLPKTAPLFQYANSIKESWNTSFDKMQYAARFYTARGLSGGNEGDVLTQEEAIYFNTLFEGMTIKNIDTYKTQAKMAYLALDYLKDDWACMLGYLIKE